MAIIDDVIHSCKIFLNNRFRSWNVRRHQMHTRAPLLLLAALPPESNSTSWNKLIFVRMWNPSVPHTPPCDTRGHFAQCYSEKSFVWLTPDSPLIQRVKSVPFLEADEPKGGNSCYGTLSQYNSVAFQKYLNFSLETGNCYKKGVCLNEVIYRLLLVTGWLLLLCEWPIF